MERKVDLGKHGDWRSVEGEVRAEASGRRVEEREVTHVAGNEERRDSAGGGRTQAARVRQVGRRTVVTRRRGSRPTPWTSPAGRSEGVPRQPGPKGPPPPIGAPKPAVAPAAAKPTIAPGAPTPPGTRHPAGPARPAPAQVAPGRPIPTGLAPHPGMPLPGQVVVDRPDFWNRYWPKPESPASGAAVAASVAIGLTAAATLTVSRPGLGWLLLGLVAVVGTTFVLKAEGVRLSRGRVLWGLAAIALLAVGTIRAAGWLFALCVPLAVACGSLAIAGGRTTRGLFAGAAAVPLAATRSVFWWVEGIDAVRKRKDGGRPVRLLAAVGVGVGLLVVFGALFSSADPTFAKLLSAVTPDIDGEGFFGAIVRFAAFGWGAIGAVYLATRPPAFNRIAEGGGRPVRRIEWLVPIVLLDALFVLFVAVQFRNWFGGDRYVQETAGLTYADYARGGFWQLTVVSILTLAVLAVAARKAPRCDGGDRAAMRIGLGLLATLALVVVASALARMNAYEAAYGLTRLRLLVAACEVWFGLIFLMVLANGIQLRPLGRRKGGWLQTAAFGTGVAMLLLLAALNPDRMIADRNIDRYEANGKIDTYYLSSLSADAVPAFDRLPAALQTCAMEKPSWDLRHEHDAWYEFNWGRTEARRFKVPSAACRR